MVAITDKLYGPFEVSENIGKVLLSKSMQRLKKIHQSGAAFRVDPDMNYSRYEHSIGAMLLAKILGGNEDAQVATLLHDISHTAFSHISDLLADSDEESYHELIRNKYLLKTEIPGLLANIDLDAKYVLNTKNFPLVDIEMPDLSVDRLDYLFRDMHAKRLMKKAEIKKVLSELFLDKGVINCKDTNTAKFLLDKFIMLNLKIFFDGRGEAANGLLSSVIRRLIDENVVSYDDLMQNDNFLIEKIKKTKYSYIFSIMKSNMPYRKYVGSERPIASNTKDVFLVKRTLRYIDPLVIGKNNNGVGKRITEIDADSKIKLNRYLKTEKRVYYEIPK